MPFSASSLPARNAASGAAPAPSTTLFSSSIRRSTASAIAASSTVTTWSTTRRSISNGCAPACATARPSASVGDSVTVTGCPAASAAVRHAACAGSTPMTRDVGLARLDDGADAGEQAAAADRHDDRLHARRLLEDLERHRALAGHHVRVVERMDEREAVARGERLGLRARVGQVGAVQHDVAPSCRQLVTLISGANFGMTTVTGMPSSAP